MPLMLYVCSYVSLLVSRRLVYRNMNTDEYSHAKILFVLPVGVSVIVIDAIDDSAKPS